jgi:Lamin Tail Domain
MKSPNRLSIPLLIVLSLLALAPSSRALDDLILTEFMAVNDNVLPDEDGDFPDWIELFNSGTNTVNLNGWYLTDNPGNPTKWRFPGATMAPNSYLIVYASSKDRKTVGRPLHTNFKLGSNLGGYLALMKPDGLTVQSRYPLYPVQAPNVSFGFPVTQVSSLLVSNGSQGVFTVPLNAANEAVWSQITFDPVGWANITNGIGFEAEPLSTNTAVLMADSVTDWSASGTQGANGWFYGYWDKKVDGNGTYEAADFTQFPRGTGNVLAPTNYWDGTKWDYPAGNPPWTEISSGGAHPAGENGNPALPIHWPIRRYISETNGNLRITGVLAASGTGGNCGDGTIGRIFVDGVEVWQQAVFNRSVGYSIIVSASVGSAIDFAVDPGTANNDACDGTTFTANIRTAADFAPVADTIADWSVTGTQGAKGWQYGWYDVVADTFAGYQTTNFNAFPNNGGPHSGANFWNGSEWQWFDGEPPFDRIGQYTCTPNIFPSGGTNANQHWVIRRWTSEIAGTLLIDWHLSKRNLTGAGVVGRIFRNGTQVDALTVAAAEFNGVIRTVTIPGVQVGDLLDFTVEPGADIIGDDCFFNAVIHATSTLSNQFTSNVGGVMTNINATAWLRYSFNITDPSGVSSLSLRMKYDDGFAAWLNGTLVASANSPDIPAWNSTATGTRPDAVEPRWRERSASGRHQRAGHSGAKPQRNRP